MEVAMNVPTLDRREPGASSPLEKASTCCAMI
jgi:hypothetical protein